MTPTKRKTADQRRESYRRLRSCLILALGGRCVGCGTGNHAVLEFHHTVSRLWNAAKASRSTRLANYHREAIRIDDETGQATLTGEIELRCGDCNKRIGKSKPLAQCSDDW